MTEQTIPSWSSMKKYYKETRSALFPLPDSIQKRDPRLDVARENAALAGTKGPWSQDDVENNAEDDLAANPIRAYDVDRNPLPKPQPERKDIPAKRATYMEDQDKVGHYGMDSLSDDDRLRDYLARGRTGRPTFTPEEINWILGRLSDYYLDNLQTARQGKMDTNKALGLHPHASVDEQQERIQPGRR